ncbi:MAG: beta-lactamase family protein [Flavobacteriales bacterium]|nr:beta-lactamase family protein [Flavobacteriales bacterium]
MSVALVSCTLPEKPEGSLSTPIEIQYKIPPELEPKVNLINELVESKIKSGTFNGVVLVAEYGNVLYIKANGYANFKTKEILNEHSVFQLASVSKMFTAAAVVILKEKGLLNYDDLVIKYLPLFPYEDITIRQLLQHRSGLPRYMVTSDLFWPRDTPMSNEDLYYLMAEQCPPRYFSADRKFNYQNSNYAYLAYLVEVVSKQPFERFVKQNIFEPLGMWNSFVYSINGETDIPGMVAGHIYRRPQPLNPATNYINGVVGDKGIYSNVHDLLKFDQALYTETLISQNSIAEAFTPGKRNPYTKRDDYGFGWRISTFNKDRLVYHYGWWNGFKSAFFRFLDKRRTVIVLTNRDRTLSLPKEIQEILYSDASENQSAVDYFSTNQ